MPDVLAIWLRTIGDTIEVLAEVPTHCAGHPGTPQWRLIISEGRDNPISHIVESSGIVNAPSDPMTGPGS
jgi:hypothetical protein